MSSMISPSNDMAAGLRLSSFIDTGIATCLLFILGALVYGHVGGDAGGLSLLDSYVSEYMRKAPHWPWLIVASFAFALLLFLLALTFLRQSEGRILIIIGCLLLAATATGNFFVAYAPVRRVVQPPPSVHEWWTPTWWFTSRTAGTPYESGMADAYSDVHYRAIRLVISTGISGILVIALGCLAQSRRRAFALCTIAASLAMSVLFLLGDYSGFRRGLWQRLGFAVMYGWLWAAWWHSRRFHKFHAPNGKP